MPLFEFTCPKCQTTVDEIILHENIDKVRCNKCDSRMTRKIDVSNTFKLKGQCWAENGYMRGEK